MVLQKICSKQDSRKEKLADNWFLALVINELIRKLVLNLVSVDQVFSFRKIIVAKCYLGLNEDFK